MGTLLGVYQIYGTIILVQMYMYILYVHEIHVVILHTYMDTCYIMHSKIVLYSIACLSYTVPP